MRIWHGLTFGVLAAACAGFAGQGNSKSASSFATLQAGQTIEVDFRSSGCFRSEHLSFRFRNENGLRVEVSNFKFDTKTREEVLEPLGSLRLNKNDAIALDGLLKFYRTKPEGHCTSVDSGAIRLMQGGKEISSESFRDATCSASNSEMLKLSDLANRLKKE